MKHNHLRDLIGVRVRRQYFNLPIYMFLLIFLLIVESFAVISLFEGNFNFEFWIEDVVLKSLITLGIFVTPCIFLSTLNRFFFGKIVCVLNEEGIHYKDGLIKWSDIKCIEYSITAMSRQHFQTAYVDVVCINTTIRIKSVPLYIFSLVKKFNADIKTKHDKTIWVLLTVVIIIPLVCSLLKR